VWGNSNSLPVVLYDGTYYVHGVGLVSKTDSQDGHLYYLTDGLASTTGLTDGGGSVVGTYTYDVFGAVRSETGEQANNYRLTGHQLPKRIAAASAHPLAPSPSPPAPRPRARPLS
jgi:hypothetical protein